MKKIGCPALGVNILDVVCRFVIFSSCKLNNNLAPSHVTVIICKPSLVNRDITFGKRSAPVVLAVGKWAYRNFKWVNSPLIKNTRTHLASGRLKVLLLLSCSSPINKQRLFMELVINQRFLYIHFI